MKMTKPLIHHFYTKFHRNSLSTKTKLKFGRVYMKKNIKPKWNFVSREKGFHFFSFFFFRMKCILPRNITIAVRFEFMLVNNSIQWLLAALKKSYFFNHCFCRDADQVVHTQTGWHSILMITVVWWGKNLKAKNRSVILNKRPLSCVLRSLRFS